MNPNQKKKKNKSQSDKKVYELRVKIKGHNPEGKKDNPDKTNSAQGIKREINEENKRKISPHKKGVNQQKKISPNKILYKPKQKKVSPKRKKK